MLQIRASDYGSPRRRATVRVSVHVMETQAKGHTVTLQPPAPLHAQVTELDPVGYLVAVVQPSNTDSSLVWFSIVGQYVLQTYTLDTLNFLYELKAAQCFPMITLASVK